MSKKSECLAAMAYVLLYHPFM